MHVRSLAAALLLICPVAALAQQSSVPATAAVRTATAPVIDGRLDDTAWTTGAAIHTFTQRDPDEGVAASEATEVWIVYDRDALYIAARLHDRSRVTSRLGRRDMATFQYFGDGPRNFPGGLHDDGTAVHL